MAKVDEMVVKLAGEEGKEVVVDEEVEMGLVEAVEVKAETAEVKETEVVEVDWVVEVEVTVEVVKKVGAVEVVKEGV